MTAEDAEQDVCATHEYLTSHGYTGADHYAYPNGGVNPMVPSSIHILLRPARPTV